MDMTIPVTLIVKAPNQQIEDQTVKCELSWTISKLKNHLSEVYPSKPARHEQKLIYSGQLLPDTVVLKDVLRNYDGQDTHTVHLVCAPPKNTFYKSEKQKMNERPTQNVTQENNLNQTPSATSTNINTPSNISTSSNVPNQVPDFRTVWTSLAQTYPGIPDANQYAVHAAIMQQAYAQYVNQYMQMYTHQRFTDQQVTQPEPAPPEPANVEQANRNDQDIDDPQQDRDWLDWFYVLSRIIVLFCIVYFYSSPLRFALVLLLGVGLYLYQTGFFRAPVLNNNDGRGQENNNVQNGDSNDSNQQNAQIDQRPSAFAIMWTFFTSFFASLIPEIPNAL